MEAPDDSPLHSVSMLKDSAVDFSVEFLKGKWRATRLSEWTICLIPHDQRRCHYVWHFDDKGNYSLQHNPEEFGQVSFTQA